MGIAIGQDLYTQTKSTLFGEKNELAIWSTPAIDENGRIYFVGTDNYLYCVAADVFLYAN